MFNSLALRSLIEEEQIQNEKTVRRRLRDASNPLELQTSLFKQHYRVSKSVFKYLLEVLEKDIPAAKKPFAVPSVIKLAACLRFFAEGGYQKGVGRDKDVALAQSTFSIMLSEVLSVFERELCPKWISWPLNSEILKIKEDFYRVHNIPGVIGAVDGTHVNIISPKTNKHLYYNRKGKFSINVMLVCDNKLLIRYVDATHPGASHDSSIWNSSQWRDDMKNDYERGVRNSWVLGDAGYPLEPWILTPFRNPQPDSVEMKFNNIHGKCRNVIERVNGVLKNRWRCLLAARELHYTPEKAVQIINVCCALHNICIAHNNVLEDVEIITENNADEDFPTISSVSGEAIGRDAQRIRQNIANAL